MAVKDWYHHRDELEPGQVFLDYEGDKVKLDSRVPGDGTQWYAFVYYGGSWIGDHHVVEPGDLRERLGE